MAAAPALETARETPRMAFAPRLALFDVSSISFIRLSMAVWSVGSMPRILGAILSFTLATAPRTPLPMYRSPWSRSSTASYAPVDAPLGTDARCSWPPDMMSTSTVGLPRLSKICRALTESITAIWDTARRAVCTAAAECCCTALLNAYVVLASITVSIVRT